MIAAWIASAVLTLVVITWWAAVSYRGHQRHGRSGDGELTVAYLLDQGETDDASGGRHRLREPVTLTGDLADDIADLQTRILPLPPEVLDLDSDDQARNLLVLHRLAAGVKQI